MVVGDELASSMGDARGMGWPGRLAARTVSPAPVFLTALPIPGEASAQLAERAIEEAMRRFHPDADNRLVIGLGIHDLAQRVSRPRSRVNLAKILDASIHSHIPTMVVGPPPVGGFMDPEIDALSSSFRDVTERRRMKYVETFEPLRSHDQWHTDLAQFSGHHPGQAGYGLLTYLVLHSGWHTWLGLSEP